MNVLNSNKVRAELFKIFYKKNKFNLHNGADAWEALDNILTILHAAFATQGIVDKDEKDKLNYDDSANLDCLNRCLAHHFFFQQ